MSVRGWGGQCSCFAFFIGVSVVDVHFRWADEFGHPQRMSGLSLRDDRQSGSERAVMKAGVEDGGAQPVGGDAVAVRLRDALDEPVQAQTSQVVCDPSRGELARLLPEQWSQMLAEIAVSECALDENKQKQDVQ